MYQEFSCIRHTAYWPVANFCKNVKTKNELYTSLTGVSMARGGKQFHRCALHRQVHLLCDKLCWTRPTSDLSTILSRPGHDFFFHPPAHSCLTYCNAIPSDLHPFLQTTKFSPEAEPFLLPWNNRACMPSLLHGSHNHTTRLHMSTGANHCSKYFCCNILLGGFAQIEHLKMRFFKPCHT
uniref:Uncharacterized protein n=1 Tax=Arundo donax TaxID=35708 RepID=A0A0A9DL23_ARUDO